MVDVKHFRDASQDFAEDFGALREDIAKLTTSVAELVRAQASSAANAVIEGTESARQQLSNGAAGAQNRLRGVGADTEATIERNPLAAVLTALSAGLLIGMMSGARR
jgi:ElaB/YqjD/DUF883 family membrane-anchored ribosome-binding protein